MSLHYQFILLSFVLGFAFPNTSDADAPPPAGYIETCTLEKQHYNETDCFECDGSYMGPAPADGGEPDADYGTCEAESVYSSQEYEKKCQSWGSSFWTEIWCKPSPGAVGPAGDPPSNDNSCSAVAPGISPARTPALSLFRLIWAGR